MNWIGTLLALLWIAPAVGIALGVTLSISHEELTRMLGSNTWFLPVFASTLVAAWVALIVSQGKAKSELWRNAKRCIVYAIFSLIAVPLTHSIPRIVGSGGGDPTAALGRPSERLLAQLVIIVPLALLLFSLAQSMYLIARRGGGLEETA